MLSVTKKRKVAWFRLLFITQKKKIIKISQLFDMVWWGINLSALLRKLHHPHQTSLHNFKISGDKNCLCYWKRYPAEVIFWDFKNSSWDSGEKSVRERKQKTQISLDLLSFWHNSLHIWNQWRSKVRLMCQGYWKGPSKARLFCPVFTQPKSALYPAQNILCLLMS